MANKNYFWNKKTLSKRAQALLEEINQSKGVQSVKESGQALSKRAQALLEEINQSKGVQSVKESGQALSKRAQALLEEINQSKGIQSIKEAADLAASFVGIQSQDEEKLPKKSEALKTPQRRKKGGKKNKKIFLPAGGFNPALYRNLTSNNKIYMWAFEIFALTGLSLVFLIQIGDGINLKNNYQSYEPKIESAKKEIEAIKHKMFPIKKEKMALDLKLTNERKYFPSLVQAQSNSDDITRLFELSNLVIIKQNIKYADRYMGDLDKDPPIQYSLPPEEVSIFSADSGELKATPASTPKSPGAKPPATIKGAIATLTASPSASKLGAAVLEELNKNPPSPPLPSALPKDMNIITYDLILKGSYLNYLKARNALTRTIPSVTIPYEDIFSSQDKQNIEFRVMIEIPIRF